MRVVSKTSLLCRCTGGLHAQLPMSSGTQEPTEMPQAITKCCQAHLRTELATRLCDALPECTGLSALWRLVDNWDSDI